MVDLEVATGEIFTGGGSPRRARTVRSLHDSESCDLGEQGLSFPPPSECNLPSFAFTAPITCGKNGPIQRAALD